MSSTAHLVSVEGDQPEQITSKSINYVFSYCMLLRREIDLSIDQSHIKAKISNYSFDDNELILSKDEGNFNSLMGSVALTNVELSMPYGTQRYVAKTKVIGVDHGALKVELPNTWSIGPTRAFSRWIPQFDAEAVIDITVKDPFIKGKTSCVNLAVKDLENISTGGLCLNWPKSTTIPLKGDKVEKINIHIKGKKVFSSEGRVAWVREHKGRNDCIQIGINFESDVIKKEKENGGSDLSRRAIERVKLGSGLASAFIRFQHPFNSKYILRGAVYDITTNGCSIVFEDKDVCLPIGTFAINATCQIPFAESIDVTLELKHTKALNIRSADGASEEVQYLYGFRFHSVDQALFKRLSELVIQNNSYPVRDAKYEQLDMIWRFFFETGFIYEKKRNLLYNKFPEIQKTYERLLTTESHLLRKLIYYRENKIYAHISAFALYEQTWLVQHLAAKKDYSKPTSLDVIMAIMEIFIQVAESDDLPTQFCQFYYRPDNFYPNTVFGGATKRLNLPEKATIRTFHYCTFSGEVSKIQAEVLTGKALEEFEGYIIQNEIALHIRADSLLKESVELPKLSKEYSKIGMFRKRTVLNINNKGYAIVDCGDTGINLSDINNSIRVFPKTLSNTEECLMGAIDWQRNNYKDRDFAILLTAEQKNSCLHKGLIEKTVYNLWTMDLGEVRAFRQHVKDIFYELKNRATRHKSGKDSTS